MIEPSDFITLDEIQLKENLCFEVPSMNIGEITTKLLKGNNVSLVKVIWNQGSGDGK